MVERIDDNTKVTLTFRQLKMLVTEISSTFRCKDPLLVDEAVLLAMEKYGIVNEMAFAKRVYENKVFGLRLELARNWCLCKWCQMYSSENANFSHWAGELVAHMDNIQFMDIKGGIDKRKTLETLLADKCDFNKVDMVESIVRDKFHIEGINNKEQISAVVNSFVSGIGDLIGILSDRNASIRDYISTEFNYDFTD